MENDPFDQPPPRRQFGLAHLALVAILALGAGAGTAWMLTRGAVQSTPIPQTVQSVALATPPNLSTLAPRLAAPTASAPVPPAPLPKRELAVGPAAAPIPVPQQPRPQREAVQQQQQPAPITDERVLAPPPGAAQQQQEQQQLGAARTGECERYTTEIVIDGKRMQRTGTACLQPDGTWRMRAD